MAAVYFLLGKFAAQRQLVSRYLLHCVWQSAQARNPAQRDRIFPHDRPLSVKWHITITSCIAADNSFSQSADNHGTVAFSPCTGILYAGIAQVRSSPGTVLAVVIASGCSSLSL